MLKKSAVQDSSVSTSWGAPTAGYIKVFPYAASTSHEAYKYPSHDLPLDQLPPWPVGFSSMPQAKDSVYPANSDATKRGALL